MLELLLMNHKIHVMSCYPLRMKMHITEKEPEMPESENLSQE